MIRAVLMALLAFAQVAWGQAAPVDADAERVFQAIDEGKELLA